jgi:hypothetical protein
MNKGGDMSYYLIEGNTTGPFEAWEVDEINSTAREPYRVVTEGAANDVAVCDLCGKLAPHCHPEEFENVRPYWFDEDEGRDYAEEAYNAMLMREE